MLRGYAALSVWIVQVKGQDLGLWAKVAGEGDEAAGVTFGCCS